MSHSQIYEMIKHIQILRFLAAMWVAVFHGAVLGIFTDFPHWLGFIINMGYAGVDIFFVISGVIMAHSTKNTAHGARAAGAFVLNRFSRIYMGWWPALLLYLVFFKVTQQLDPHINFQGSFYLYFTDLTGLINIVIWSLMFELYFYILLAAALLFSRDQRQNFLKMMLGVLVVINVYFFLDRTSTDAGLQRDWIKLFYVAPIVAEFFMGYFLYHYLQSHSSSPWKLWGALAAASLGLLVYMVPHFEDHPYGLANFHYWPERTLLMGGAALAIAGLALTLPSPRSPIARIMAKLGDYSYAIYVLHILVFNMALVLLPWKSLDGLPRIAIAIFVLLALLSASAVYYHAVERPLYMFCREKINRWLQPLSSDRSSLSTIHKN